jgi:hypothetical protein
VSTGDIDRDGNTGAARLGTGDRSHSALGEAFVFKGAIDRAWVGGRRGRRGISRKGSGLVRRERAFDGLRRGLVRVWRCSRRGVGHGHSGRAVWVKDKLFDGDDLLAIAELLKLTEEGLDLVNESFTLCLLELTENLFCGGLVKIASRTR